MMSEAVVIPLILSTHKQLKSVTMFTFDEKFTDGILKHKDHCFVTFPLDSFLKEFLESYYSDGHLTQPNKNHTIASIVDGQKYKKL